MTKRETREEFIARYPKPAEYRVLVACECNFEECTGWAWTYSYDGDVMPYETIVEEP